MIELDEDIKIVATTIFFVLKRLVKYIHRFDINSKQTQRNKQKKRASQTLRDKNHNV